MEQGHGSHFKYSSLIISGCSLVVTVITAIAGALEYLRDHVFLIWLVIAAAVSLLLITLRIVLKNNTSEELDKLSLAFNINCIIVAIMFILFAVFSNARTTIHEIQEHILATPTIVPTASPTPEIPDPADKIAAGNDFSMLLRSDKKVVTYGQATGIDTSSWENIIQIAAYKDHAIGLREDRTVVVTGKDYEQYDVSGWSGIRQVVACKDGVVGVTMDGDIRFDSLNKDCMLDCQSWDHVQRVVGAACILVAERNDGSMIAANAWEVTDPYMTSLEKRIVSGTAVDDRMLLVLDNGRVKATGESSVLENLVATWTDMLQVAVGNGFAIGLKEDNSVLSIGAPNNEELSVSGWENVAAICVGGSHILGLCEDGTVLTDGSEAGGLANIANEDYWVSN